jgi:chromosome segregation ATPase
VTQLEDKCIKLDKEKGALNDLLALRKKEAERANDEWNEKVFELENDIRRLTNDKNRLINQIGVPEKDRGVVQRQEAELSALQRRLEDLMNQYADLEDENSDLKKEISDLQLEMDEMHDHYRGEEAGTFRALQRDLDVASKNCRILQVQVKKVERRNEQLEAEIKELEQRAAVNGQPVGTNNAGVPTQTAATKRLEDEIKQQATEIARLQATLAATEKERDGLRLELTNEKKCVLKLDDERLTALQQYEALRKDVSMTVHTRQLC